MRACCGTLYMQLLGSGKDLAWILHGSRKHFGGIAFLQESLPVYLERNLARHLSRCWKIKLSCWICFQLVVRIWLRFVRMSSLTLTCPR